MADFRDSPGFLIRRLNQMAGQAFTDIASGQGYDLTPVQFAALNALGDNPGIDQATLAGIIAYDRVTIGGVVGRLIEKGFVDRQTSARDRRARELFLTQEGRALLDRFWPLVPPIQERILEKLPVQDRAELVRLLRHAIHGPGEDR